MGLRDFIEKEWTQIRLDYGYYYILPILLVLCTVLILRRLSSSKLRLPPGPTGFPLVGYIPFLGKEPYKVMDKLSKKYGNVFSISIGQTLVVILGDYTAVKEALSKSTTIDRPPGLFDLLPDDIGFGSSNGTEWVEQRRFVVRSMKDIGLGRSTWSRLVEDEVNDFLEILLKKKGKPIAIAEDLTCSLASNIGSLVLGKRLPPGPERDSLNRSIDIVMSFFTLFGLRNFFPRLCDFIYKLNITKYNSSYRDMVVFNKMIRSIIEKHRQSGIGLKGDDFVSSYVHAMDTNKAEGNETTFNEKNLVGNTQVLYLAGTDTARASLIWLFLAMTAHPGIQDKVHRELDTVLGKKERAAWEDRAKFPYVYATIMECQRWLTIVPLNSTRVATEDIKICGYDIPKGTPIMGNTWALHHDTRYWSEPEKFQPERFLQNGGKEVILKPESYVPFSYGKRKCPGEIVALMEIFLYFTAIMQVFEVKAPEGARPNFEGILGLTYQPPLQELCFVLRQNVSEKI